MPSIQDVADQINAKLDSITAATEQTAVGVNDLNAGLNALRAEQHADNVNVSQGLYALVELQRVTVHLLDYHRRQHDTIICELTQVNEQLCTISRTLARQLEVAKSTNVSTRRLEGIAERLHAGEAADYDRDLAVQERIAECCPPQRPEPEPCPPPCDRPGFDPLRPDGQKWEPLHDRQPEPIG